MIGLGSIDSHFFDRQHIASATAKRVDQYRMCGPLVRRPS